MPRNNFYSNTTEPNMRNELISMFDGMWPEISKKQRCILRQMRRNDSGDLINCPCRSETNQEWDKSKYCPYCLGEGYYWDEVWSDMYWHVIRSDVGNATRDSLIGPGLENVEVAVFFLRWSNDITSDDKMVRVKLNKDGSVYYPYRREAIYKIDGLIPLRSDNAKLEFWKLACYEENVKFLNGPNG